MKKIAVTLTLGVALLSSARAADGTDSEKANDWLQQIWMNTASESVRQGKVRWEVSEDKVNWSAISAPLEEGSEQQRYSQSHLRMHYFGFAAKGRYVRLTITAPPEGMPVGLRELEIYQNLKTQPKN